MILRVLILLVGATIFIAGQDGGRVRATSNGAGNCLSGDQDMADFINAHGGPDALGTGNTNIIFSSPTFAPGCVYTVSVCSGGDTPTTLAPYNGFILAGHDMDTNAHVGHFADPTANNVGVVTAKLLSCGYGDSTVTHSLPTPQSQQHFKWTAPTNPSVAAVHFQLLTVRASPSNWYKLEVMVDGADTGATCPVALATNPCPGFDGVAPTNTTTTGHQIHDMGDMQGMSGIMQGMQGMQMNTVFQSGAWSGVGIVFPGWVINSTFTYVITIIAIFLIAFFAQWLLVVVRHVDGYFVLKNSTAAISIAKFGGVELIGVNSVNITPSLSTPAALPVSAPPFSNTQQLSRTSLQFVQTFLSFFLMVVFMILDMGLCLALLCGHGVGFFLFAPRSKPMDPDDVQSCH